VAGTRDRCNHVTYHCVNSQRVRENRRLSIMGQGQVAVRTLPHDPREGHPQGIVDLLKNLQRSGKALCYIFPHPHTLRPLART